MSPGVRNMFETGVYNMCKTRSFKQVFAPKPYYTDALLLLPKPYDKAGAEAPEGFLVDGVGASGHSHVRSSDNSTIPRRETIIYTYKITIKVKGQQSEYQQLTIG